MTPLTPPAPPLRVRGAPLPMPPRLDALAGFSTTVAERAAVDPDADADDVRVAHALLAEARAGAPERVMLVAAYARLLLAVPSASNDAEALVAARRAHDAAPLDPDAALALGLALARREPAAGAALLEEAAAAAPRIAACSPPPPERAGPRATPLARSRSPTPPRARPGPPGRARLAPVDHRGGPSTTRCDAARWDAADPGPALPPLLLARLKYQADRDLPRRARAPRRRPPRARGDFTAARVLAERASLERGAGDRAAAARGVAEALRRVPASAAARFQEALLAFDSGDVRALRRAEGVLDGRAGPAVSALLAARVAELAARSTRRSRLTPGRPPRRRAIQPRCSRSRRARAPRRVRARARRRPPGASGAIS